MTKKICHSLSFVKNFINKFLTKEFIIAYEILLNALKHIHEQNLSATHLKFSSSPALSNLLFDT